jgi:hypothetical protein
VRVAIQRWNDAGCVPALKEVDEGPASVTVTEGDPGDDNAGVYNWRSDDDDKTTSGTVTIRNNPNPGLVETATHELGHALGLDDTDEDDNPGDVMKGTGPSNGTNGALSEHDLAEMEAAAEAITPIGEDPDEHIYAIFPPQAIIPGEATMLHFNIPTYFPPETEYWVEPIANNNLEVTNVELFEDILEVNVLTMPHHWSGKIYLGLHFFDPEGLHTQYLGIHYISQDPVVPIDNFECPFITTIEGNTVHVQWNELHNYPFDQPLRSTLMVNGNTFYKVKPSGDAPPGYYGDYTITLEPGIHELTLFVDDYQVNSASFSMDVFIEEPPPPPPPEPYFELTPNGKTNPEDWYRWITGMDGETPVPLLTNVPEDITAVRFYFSFDPATEVWIQFWEDQDGTSNAAPGEPGSYDEDYDGWCGYLYHEMLGAQTTEVFFKAEVEGLDGIIHEVFSEISLLYTLTPPSAFQITTDGGVVLDDLFVTDQPQLSLQFDPAHDNFDYAQFQVTEALDSIYDKSIPHIKQPNNYYCGPAALAMCLKYFAGLNKMNMKDPTGGLSDKALMDSLAKYCGTKPSNGTTEKGMVSGANEWIKKQGGGYTVQDFKDFDDFGIKEMAKHLMHDGKQNGVSQNIISLFRLITHAGDTMDHFMTLSSAHKTAAGYNRFDYEDPSSSPPASKIAFDIDENGVASNPTFADGEPIENYPYKKVELLSQMMICPIETQVTSSGGEITQGPEFPGVEIEVPGGLAGARVRAVDNNGKKHERDILIRRVNPPVCPEDINAPLNGPPFQLPDGQPGGGTSDGPGDVFIDPWFWPIEVGIFPITYTVEYDGFEFSCEYTVTVTPYDFGDAPDPTYPTLYASNGARHIIDGVTFLGQSVDPEPDGQQNSDATGDDNDGNNDDDGVTFGEIMVGSAAQVVVTTSVAGYLQGWMDLNADGDWDDPGEQIFVDEFIHFGQTVCLNYEVPADATPGLTFARFRFSTQPNISHSGLAEDGEVEDYQVLIIENTEHKWAQESCEQLSGLHCHDYETEGTYYLPVLADDWLCNGGQVTEIQWWGNYETDDLDNEMRFSGIKQFQLSIFDHQPDGCLPVMQPAWTATVVLTAANETPTGLFDGEGGMIYAYSYTLSVPFDQIEGNQYWLGMTAVANDPVAPPHWRWQESSRSVSTVLCPASSRLNNSPWQHYTWTGIEPVRFSQMAFGIISGDYVPPEPPTADLIPKGKTNPEPWYRWITDPDGVTPVLLLTDDPNAIDKVSFYYSDDPALTEWTLFWEDEDGDSNSAPGGPGSESDDHDGWCGYLDHELLGQNPAELFFKAEVETTSGALFDVLSEISLFYTLTPPDDFLITTSEGHVIEKEYVTDQFPLTLYFTPQHENFDYAQVQQSEDLPLVYDKEIPQIMQPNNYYCGPASLAMCLKYFANTNETLYGHVTGDLSDTALMDSLANRCGTISPTGTTKSGMVSGVTKWIDKQGGGFTVQGFKNFSEFGKDSLVKHLLHDGLQNNVSQNIISRFMLIKYNEVTQKDDTLYHYMTLSSVHEKDSAYKRFDYADPMIPPGVGRLAFDLDDEGVASDFKFHDGGEIENFPYKKVQLLSSMMICPKETSIVPDEGETTEGPEFTPIESDVPEGSSRATRVRAVDNDGNKHETDIILRRAPTPVCQDEIILPLGGPPHKLDGCTPGGGTYDGPNITDGWFFPDEEGTFIITYTIVYYGFETSCNFTITVVGYDFGDAPDDPYPTLLTSDGARHQVSSNLFMGQLVDPEPDGQPCPFALGDDQDGTDDEDGVRFLNSFLPGETVTVEVTLFGSGYLNAWFDWNANGSWGDPFEHVIVNHPVTTGTHSFDITVPASAAPGFTFARFRLTSESGLSYQGIAPDGEVEDYRIRINEPMDHKMHYPQYPDPAGWDVRLPEIELITDIADDWMCSESGYVEDIHFWISWNGDAVPQDFNVDFNIRIYDDIPAGESPTEYSMPGNMLWQKSFNPGSYTYEFVFEHPQGWFNPFVPEPVHIPWDHMNCYRIDIVDIPEPFEQEEGIVYWLVISANAPDPDLQAGWKTSPDHFNDIAVWFNTSTAHGWQPLFDPITQEALSMSFVINGNPVPPTYNLIVVSEPTYAGVVLGGGNVLPGTIVTLTAIANEGWGFENWTDDEGNVISIIDIFDYTMPESDITLTANFTPSAFVVYCPDDIETVNDPGACFATNIDLGEPTIEESFGINEIYNNAPDEFPVGTTIVTWTLINEFGMTSTCDQLITVIDVEDPEIDDMEDIGTSNDPGDCGATVSWEPPAITDNCEVESVSSNFEPGDFFPVGETDVFYEVTDVHGNMSSSGFRITVIDVEDPEIDDMEDLHRDNDPGACGANVYWEPPEVTDNCEVESVSSNFEPGDFFPVGETDVFYEVTDVHGNMSSSGFRITVIDVEDPEIDDMEDIGTSNDPGDCGATVSWEPPAITDNCEVESVSSNFEPGDFFPVGETPVTYTATDVHGNTSTKGFLVTVIDVEPPEIPDDLELDDMIISEEDGAQCFEALYNIYMSNTIVASGAEVTLVAGTSIHLLPHTHIHQGALFNARIDVDGTFCGNDIIIHDEVITDIEPTPQQIRERVSFFRVYPNPTDGIFTLELLTDVDTGSIQVEVFALHGTRVLHQELPAQQLHLVDLTHFQPGMYIIRVSVGDHSGFERLIKKQR